MQRPRSNSRRMTLGSMNNVNQGGNRRKSAVGLTPSHGEGSSPIAKARPPRGRASMIPRVGRENMIPSTPNSNAKPSADPHSSSRPRNSVGGDRRQSMAAPSAPAKVDPRPISDKGYQQECIRDLLNYLVNSGYEYPISHKSLARPSGKDFTNIVTFMLRRVDTNFQDGTMKIEDEVAMNFKAMGYPFTVSKTALVAAGSPHTWPSLLAALTWLMERLQTIETSEPEDDEPGKFESLEELEQKTDKAFFKYLGQAYAAFLRGDEQLTEQLENGLADRFERDDGIIEQEIEQVTDQNSIILERINNLTMGEEE
jgi:kinetochore protein NDC80